MTVVLAVWGPLMGAAIALTVGLTLLWLGGDAAQRTYESHMRYGGPGISEDGDGSTIFGIVALIAFMVFLGIGLAHLWRLPGTGYHSGLALLAATAAVVAVPAIPWYTGKLAIAGWKRLAARGRTVPA